jgi:replicative DNA helicase
MNRIQAEETILKALYHLADPTRTEEIFSKLTGDHFTDSDNLKAFTVAIEGYAKNGAVPFTTKYYEHHGSIQEALDIIRTEHKRKRIADFCDEALSKLMIEEPDKVLRSLSNRLDLLNANSDGDPKPLRSHIIDLIADLKKPESMMVQVGIKDFDFKLGGFRAGQLIIVAARPGMGKSVFASQVAVNNSARNIPVLFLSLEMSGIEISSRIVSGHMGISSTALQRRSLTDEDWDVLERAPEHMDIPLYIHDKADMDILSIRALIRKYVRSYGVKFVVVDYIGLINEPKDGNENREQQVARMSRFFKTEAKEQDIPIMVLAQLNREMEKRASKKPQLSDLRESGSIEQDADTVIFLHRPEMVGVPDMPDGSSSQGKIIIDVAKRRSGTTGFITAHFNGDKQIIGGEAWEI